MPHSKTVLITGCAGFIGSSVARELIKSGNVIGIDNFAPNYDSDTKMANVKPILKSSRFTFLTADILDESKMHDLFKKYQPHVVLHLAALTGVRASLKNKEKYDLVNTIGTKKVFDLAQKNVVKHFIFSSSSSVYGNCAVPFKEEMHLDPQSPYASSKQKAEELLLANTSSNRPIITILRFFSVFGPHGRPDMAPYLFTQAALKKKQITQYGDGSSARDYTYIDDVVSAVSKVIKHPYDKEIINIGSSSPVTLKKLIQTVERLTGKVVNRKITVPKKEESAITYADITKAKRLINWKPQISFGDGMSNFVNWYKKNYDSNTKIL